MSGGLRSAPTACWSRRGSNRYDTCRGQSAERDFAAGLMTMMRTFAHAAGMRRSCGKRLRERNHSPEQREEQQRLAIRRRM